MSGEGRFFSIGSFLILIFSILVFLTIPLSSAQSSWTETNSSDFSDGLLENTEVVSDDVRLLEVPADDWTQATSSASWSDRGHHTSLVFRGVMWVIGGSTSGGLKNDVWYSSDGSSWSQATPSASWTGRWGHTSVTYDGNMWVLGGTDNNSIPNEGLKDDVWYSSDGSGWTEATSDAFWTPRYTQSSVAYDGKIWVLGGLDGNPKNDVWFSTDGSSWSEATSDASWDERWDHTSITYDDKMWIMGGMEYVDYTSIERDDVWYSSDGSSWSEATSDASWTARTRHASVVYNGKMWILGGKNSDNLYNDIWYSSDGLNWTQATSDASWSERAVHTSVVYDNKIWVIGGYSGSYEDDVWWWAPYRELGTYVSSNHDTGADDTEISQVSWNATGSDISVEVAAGNSQDPTNWESVSNGDTSISASGRYVRYRVAFNGSGLSDDPELNSITIDYSTPNSSPSADFSYSTDGLSADFSDISSDSDGSISSWSWDFGDGNSSSQQSPSHSYSSSGDYTVELTVTDDDGATDSKSKTISVSETNSSPSADFSYSTDGLSVEFSDGSSDSDGSIQSWSWDFGDGNSSSQQSPSHSYSSSGDYTVELSVTDDDDAINTESKTVTVSESNQSPSADFSYATDGLTVHFLDGSSDSDGSIQSWSWDVDNDGVEDNTAQNPSNTYPSEGSYEVTLTVTDDDDASDKKTEIVSVSEGGAPTTSVSVTGYVKSDGEPVEGATVTIGEMTATTDSEGYYIIENLKTDEIYTATVDAPDYESYSKNFSISNQDKTLDEIDLTKASSDGFNTLIVVVMVEVILIGAGVFIYMKRETLLS